MQGQHSSLAEADQDQFRIIQSITLELGVKKGIDGGLRLINANPLLIGIAHRQREPLPPRSRLGAGFGGMRRDKSSIGQKILPLFGYRNKIIAIGTVAMQEDDKLLGVTRFRRNPRTIDR
jgi:hypothetical protein